MKLNPTQIKNLKPEPGKKVTRHYDGNGLFLFITDKGQKWWRFKFSFAGKEGMLSLGTFPAVSLKDARQQATECKDMIKQGINPAENRKATKAAERGKESNSFEVLAREWFAVKTADLNAQHRGKVIASLEKDIFPFIGSKSSTDIEAPELLTLLRRVEDRGATESAHRILSRCSMVFRYGIQTGRCLSDPARDLRGALKPINKKGHHAATTDPAGVAAILQACDNYHGYFVVTCALKLAPLVFVRPGELRQAEWKDFDLAAAEWRYMVSKTKTEHIVPLSRQALAIIRELQKYSSDSPYVFPAATSKNRPMSNNAVLAAFRRMGITGDEMTGHGWRATARTILDEVLRFPVDIIEHQLAHIVKDPLGRAYNRTTHIEARQEMMQTWADYLDELRASPNPDHKALREKYKYRG
jgi:integrase